MNLGPVRCCIPYCQSKGGRLSDLGGDTDGSVQASKTGIGNPQQIKHYNLRNAFEKSKKALNPQSIV